MRFLILLLVLRVTSPLCGQEKMISLLPTELNETSGLVIVGDKFISMNDSGSDAEIIVFTKKGKILHTVKIIDAKNTDWEALTLDDKGNLYIADIGDNKNKRQELQIYIVSLQDVLEGKDVKAKRINFNYSDKQSFPPEKDQLYYDAEAIVYKNDSLFVFTKNRTQPFDGIVKIYGFPAKPGNYTIQQVGSIQLPETTWLENSVTDATLYKKHLYLLTYRYIYVYKWKGSTFEQQSVIEFDSATQKEGIFYKNGRLYVTDEKSILGKARLYEVILNQ